MSRYFLCPSDYCGQTNQHYIVAPQPTSVSRNGIEMSGFYNALGSIRPGLCMCGDAAEG